MITNESFACEINIPYGWSDHLSLSQQEEACWFEQKFGLRWKKYQYFDALMASARGMQRATFSLFGGGFAVTGLFWVSGAMKIILSFNKYFLDS